MAQEMQALDAVNSQVMLSYRVPEAGAKELGGDGTVNAMKSFLENQGYTVFVGESALQGGQKWSRRIQDAVVNCQAFIAISSSTYGDTEWTFREYQLADNEKKPILPVWHSGKYPPDALKIFLSGLQRVPQGNKPLVESDFGECMQQVLTCLRRMRCVPSKAPARPQSQPVPQPPPRQPAQSQVEQPSKPQPQHLPPQQKPQVHPVPLSAASKGSAAAPQPLKELEEVVQSLKGLNATSKRMDTLPEDGGAAAGADRPNMTPTDVKLHLFIMYDYLEAWAAIDPLVVQIGTWVGNSSASDPAWAEFRDKHVPQLATVQLAGARYLGRYIVISKAAQWIFKALGDVDAPDGPVAALKQLWLGDAMEVMPRCSANCPAEVRNLTVKLHRAVFTASYERLVKSEQEQPVYRKLADVLYKHLRTTLRDGLDGEDARFEQLSAESQPRLAAAVRSAVLASTLAKAIGSDSGRFQMTDPAAAFKQSKNCPAFVEERHHRMRGFASSYDVGDAPLVLLSLCPGFCQAGAEARGGVKWHEKEKVAVVERFS